MWWLDALAQGFQVPVPSIQVCAFRVVLAAAVLVKFGYEHGRGAWGYFDRLSYVYYRFQREHPRIRVGRTGYHRLYVMKFVAAACLLAGVLPRIACLCLAGWFFFELAYDRKFHTIYLGLCALFLAASPALGDALTIRTIVAAVTGSAPSALSAEVARVRDDAFAPVLLVLLTSQMYLSTAYRKLRSAQFMSGAALHSFTANSHAERNLQRYRDTWYPPLVVRHLIAVSPEVGRRRWRRAAVGTVVLEFALPPALLVPFLFPVAAVVGLLVHAAFTAVLPIRLPPFSLATVGSYLLFAPPAAVAALVGAA